MSSKTNEDSGTGRRHTSHNHRSGMRQRIITWSFVPTAIILLTVALVIFYAYEQVTEDLVVQRNRELTRLSASQLSTELEEYGDLLDALARKPEMYRGDPREQQRLLEEFSYRLSVFDGGVVVLDGRGVAGPSHPHRPDFAGLDWSARYYFRTMLTSPGVRFSDVVTDGPNNEDVLVVAVPILGENAELMGVIAAMFEVDAASVSSFYGDLVKMRFGEGGSAYLLDGEGRALFHPNEDLIGRDMTGDPIADAALSGQTRAMRAVDEEGTDVVAGYAPVPGTEWSLVVLEKWSELTAAGRSYRGYLIILLALGVVVPTAVVMTGVRRITRPIHELTSAAHEVAGGNFGRRIRVETGDELEELADQFNRMSSELQGSYEQLERRVEDRTRELSTLNSIAAVASRSFDLTSILEDSLRLTMASVGMDAGAVFRVDRETGLPELEAHQGLSHDLLRQAISIRGAEWMELLGSPEFEPSVHRAEEYLPGPLRDAMQSQGIGCTVKVPLVAKGQMLGVMALGTGAGRELTEDEMSLLDAIGDQVGVAVDNALLHAQSERNAAAAERSRLARDLHDAVSQTLFSATLIAEVLPRLWDKDPMEAQRRLDELRALTRGALAEMRTLLLELRPAALEEAELPDLLRQLAEAASGRSRTPVDVVVEGTFDLPVDRKEAMYRIAQEALNNVIKHSAASHASVRLIGDDGEVRLAVTDDGRGFDPETVTSDHLGVSIMRERAEAVGAAIEFDTAPDEGTRVVFTWRSEAIGSPRPVQ